MKKLILAFICLLFATPSQARIIYVDANATGDANGVNWTNAYIYLQDALTDALSNPDVNEIWVAQGTYTPDQGIGVAPGDREATFQLINGVIIKGGYAGFGQLDPNARDIELYETILNGDLNSDDIQLTNPADMWGEHTRFDNSYHVVTGSNTDANAIVNGFTITAGYNSWLGGGMFNQDGIPTVTDCTFTWSCAEWGGGMGNWNSSPKVIRCKFERNAAAGGGGIDNVKNSNPILINCTFSNNSGSWIGGGMVNGYAGFGGSANPVLTNCIFIGNSTDRYGGGIYNEFSSPAIANCTFNNNSAQRGGAIYSFRGSSPTITNCILYGDTALWGREIYLAFYSESQPATTIIGYSNVQEGPAGVYVETGSILNWEVGNINLDPDFAFSSDYHIMPASPCIDAGDPNYIASLEETDLDGNPRILDGNADANAVIDMGAYEFNPNSPSIAVSAASFYFINDWPDTTPQTLSIRNCGGGILNWEIIEDCNWLDVAPPNGVSYGQINEVTLTVDPNGLAPDLYSCNLAVQDPNASNNPVTVQVEFRVRTRRVPSQDYPTIQDAINAADDYDMVLVADGTYTGTGNRDIDFLGKAITVRSQSGPENCIIDCNGTGGDEHRGFYFHSGEDANSVLEGFTIINGFQMYGGGIYCDRGNPTITDCTISDNSAESWKGGGGIYCKYSNAIISNCDIIGNTTEGQGAGIHCEYGSPTIYNCTISGNTGGGGISCHEGSPTISNCTIIGNTTEGSGGGIYCDGDSPIITNCTISNNSAGGRHLGGGGIYCGYSSSPTITNCIINGNSAESRGGGICCADSGPKINNCTVTGNKAGYKGGGIHCFGSSPTITNCIFWDNEALVGPEISLGANSSIWVNYTDVQGGRDDVYIGPYCPYCTLNWGLGNIDTDPCFVLPGYWVDANDPNIIAEPNDPNAVWLEGDYHLLPNSLCIDTGDPCYIPEPNETDLDGNPRIIGDAVDMGAYEASYIEAEMNFTPKTLNCNSRGNWVKAHIALPDGFLPEDVDVNEPVWAEPIDLQSEYIKLLGSNPVKLEIAFNRETFCDAITEPSRLEVTIIGSLTTDQNFYATYSIKIIPPR